MKVVRKVTEGHSRQKQCCTGNEVLQHRDNVAPKGKALETIEIVFHLLKVSYFMVIEVYGCDESCVCNTRRGNVDGSSEKEEAQHHGQ